MRQWVCIFTLTHKGFITNLANNYLKSKGLKLATWLNRIKEGRRTDILCLFLLCVITGTHCFVHTKSGIWTTLHEEPPTQQEFIQHCNLHLRYIGCGICVELIPRRELVAFQIFGLLEPIEVDLDSKPVAIGSLSANETETLQKLLMLYTSGPVSLKERLLYTSNKLFMKQVKSFLLLLDLDTFILQCSLHNIKYI